MSLAKASLDRVASIEVFIVDLSQDQPYLGSLRDGETVNKDGYFVRKGNRTVYPRSHRSLVVRVRTGDGVEGWGETYGLVAPKATAEIIKDLLTGFVIGRDPFDREVLHDELYDLMRVRGYTGGFYLDALAAIDIALWDIAGKLTDRPVSDLIGRRLRASIPAYVSGLPENTLADRCRLAATWVDRGFEAIKFALPVADEGAATELEALRKQLGPGPRIACDLHWSLTETEAVKLANEMAPNHPWFLEAPVKPEDLEGLKRVAARAGQKIAVGEEWRTLFDARTRIETNACHIVQPEMGHTGITEFVRIGRCAETASPDLSIIPHATIGSGIFLAASLQASASLAGVEAHEFQHSVFHPVRHYLNEPLLCQNGSYQVPTAPGIGVEPSAIMRSRMVPV
ncbi:MAG: mandelate racemase/muconate lactonizing enzyme family protein [Verrucomicrobiota bacterium]